MKGLLEANTYAAMKTLCVVIWIGKDGKPLESAVRKAEVAGSYTKQKQGVVLKRLASMD